MGSVDTSARVVTALPPVMSSRVVPTVGIPQQAGKSSGSEAYYKSNLDLVARENKQLKQRLEQLEKENRDLKKSVYDLSVRHCACMDQLGKGVRPFNIDSIANLPEFIESFSLLEIISGSTEQAKTGTKPHHHVDSRHFYNKCDLKGHQGSIYAAAFSGTGNLLATGSFDQTVRVWDIHAQRETLVLREHESNVADLCWSNDSSMLLSGGFDHCVCEWDVAAGKLVHSYGGISGFVQAVRFNPADNDVFLVGSTSKQIYVFDRRLHSVGGGAALTLDSEGKINSLYLYRNGNLCLSGDSFGAIKVWELRKCQVLETVYNEQGHKPISSMDVSPPSAEEGEEGRFLAVNSFDNVLRVYDRFAVTAPKPTPETPLSTMRLVHSIGGTRNKNWTIRSSLFQGHDYRQAVGRRWPPGGPEARSRRSSGDSQQQDVSVHESLLLATGSADNKAYLYDVSGPEGTAELVQQLEGHTERVYAAVFHPTEPILATCSADCTVKLWSPKSV